MKRSFTAFVLILILTSIATIRAADVPAAASPAMLEQSGTTTNDCWATSTGGPVYVPETGHHIYEPFLSTWRQYDLAILGYPVSEPLEQNGMTVQYFERARFEHHPEYAGTAHEVLFTLLGRWAVSEQDDPAFTLLEPGIPQPDPEARYYPETGHYLQAPFAGFWDEYGGLPVFGYPTSEMLFEDGMLVQYFERARFEHHPEFDGTRYEILLGHLGQEYAGANGVDQQPVPMLENAVNYRWNPEPRSLRIPVLMYHQLGTPVSRFRVSYWDFEQQMTWLRDNGYTPVTMTGAYAGMFGGASLPEKPAIITFDDSPQSQWAAADILDRYGYKGVFFVHPNGDLKPDQLRDLAMRGHEIGSHSYSHPYLTRASDEQLWHEIYDSRKALEAVTDSPINFFAYPFGDWNNRVISVVQASGYCGAVHAWEGQQWTPGKRWNEPRVEISGELSLAAFAALIEYRPQANPTGGLAPH